MCARWRVWGRDYGDTGIDTAEPGSRMVVSSTEIGFAFAAVFASSDKVHPPVQCYDSSNGHRTNQHNQWSTTSEGKTISLGTKILQHVTVQINA